MLIRDTTPCPILTVRLRGHTTVPYVTSNGGVCFHIVPRRDFSPWLTAEALAAFDPTGREAGEFMLEIAKAAAVNNERERRRAARGGSV